MSKFDQLHEDYQRIERTVAYLEDNYLRQPSLTEIAEHAHLTEFHFQRLFSRWIGISPKRFLQYMTKEHAKNLLKESDNLLDVTFDSGLSSPGRLYDLFVKCEAMTPGEYKEKGKDIKIRYGFHPSPFGECLLAVTARGICALRFVSEDNHQELLDWLHNLWPMAKIQNRADHTEPVIDQIFSFSRDSNPAPLHLYVKGTNFQIKVWEALLRIPLGKAVTYGDIARHIGSPGAVRAVGTAVGKNPIPFLIPCQRVIRKMGGFGNYREGPTRKKIILGWETVKSQTTDSSL